MEDVHSFWAQRWSGPKLGWHKDDVNPHLAKHADLLFGGSDLCCHDDDDDNVGSGCSHSQASSPSSHHSHRVFVPLCGKSVDLAYLATRANVSHVVGIDIVRDAAVEFASDHPGLSMGEVVDRRPEEIDRCEGTMEGDGNTRCDDDDDDEDNSDAAIEPSSQSTGQGGSGIFHGGKLTMLVRDLFDLLPMTNADRAEYLTRGISNIIKLPPSSPSPHQQPPPPTEYLFDVIYDRASMVAVRPPLREDYVALMGHLLRPGGTILLVSLDRRRTATRAARGDGPPYSLDDSDIRALYESRDWVESVTLLDDVDDLTTGGDRERWERRGVLELYEMVFLVRKKD